jgi:FlaA1/EpsC-like NDP-sugar epimerase
MLHAGDVMRKYLHELSPDKMRLDQLYVRYRSLWLDIDVILWTILLLLPKIGAYSPPEQFLFVGPISRLVQRFVGWFIADFLIVLASISITGATVRLFGPLHLGWTGALGMALRFSALYACVGIILQTYRVHWSKATPWEAVRLGLNWLIATTLTITVHYYLEIESLAVFAIIVIASMLSLSGIVFIRYRRRLIDGFLSRWLVSRLRSPATRERVIIVGSGRTAEHIAWLMQHPSYAQKFRVLGFIDDDLRSQGMKIYGSKVIGILSDLPQIIQKQDVGLVILADFRTAARKFKEFCEAAKFKPAKVVVAPDIYGALSGLGRVSARDGVTAELKDFQCRHCLARYAALEDASADILEVQNMNITLTGDF